MNVNIIERFVVTRKFNQNDLKEMPSSIEDIYPDMEFQFKSLYRYDHMEGNIITKTEYILEYILISYDESKILTDEEKRITNVMFNNKRSFEFFKDDIQKLIDTKYIEP